MKKQFLHEQHNRQEKAWKIKGTGGYYGGSSASGKPKVWELDLVMDWSSNPPKCRWKKRYNEKVDKVEHKIEVLKCFRNELRKMRFIILGYKFKFSYSSANFAKANNLETSEVKSVFDKVVKDANERFDMVDLRLKRAPIELDYERLEDGNYQEVVKVKFEWRNILVPDET